MPVKYEQIDANTLAECSLGRVTSYLTTNGTIHVTLCGLFATTLAVLVAFAEQPNSTSEKIVYGIIFPAFSLVILMVSLNVSSWIHEQITYLEWFGRKRDSSIEFLYFEEFQELYWKQWLAIPLLSRLWIILKRSLVFYATIPIRFNNIYCYYIMIYAGAPILGLTRGLDGSILYWALALLVLTQIALIAVGMRSYLVLQFVRTQVTAKLWHSDAQSQDPAT